MDEIFVGYQSFQTRRHKVVERIAALAAHASPTISRFCNALLLHPQMRLEIIPTASQRVCDFDSERLALYCLTVANSRDEVHELYVSETAACLLLLYHEFLALEHDIMAFACTVMMMNEHSNFVRIGSSRLVPESYDSCSTRHDLCRIVFRATCAWNALSENVRDFLKTRLQTIEEYIGYIYVEPSVFKYNE